MFGSQYVPIKTLFCEMNESNAQIHVVVKGGLFSKKYFLVREDELANRISVQLEEIEDVLYGFVLEENSPASDRLNGSSSSSDVAFCFVEFPACS